MTAFWLVLMGYLIGSIPIAYLAARLRGHDLLDEGAGGVSGSAAIERLGPVPGAAAGFLDALKPVLVVAVAQRFESYEVSAAAGVASNPASSARPIPSATAAVSGPLSARRIL